jgi:hypothetical protein
MLSLMANEPVQPEEPYIYTRWWDIHAPSGMKRSFGSYDGRFPTTDFDGWNGPLSGTPQNGRIRILEGLAEDYELPILTDDDVIIPYLSPTKEGAGVWVKVPFSNSAGGDPEYGNDAFYFPDEPDDTPPTTIFPGLETILAVAIPLLQKNFNAGNWFRSIQLNVAVDRRYGFAGITEPFAGEEKALVSTHD